MYNSWITFLTLTLLTFLAELHIQQDPSSSRALVACWRFVSPVSCRHRVCQTRLFHHKGNDMN